MAVGLTWEQKMAALQTLTDTSLRMRAPGDWYVSMSGAALVKGSFLHSVGGDGRTPEEAVEGAWEDVTGHRVRVSRDGKDRDVVWVGCMWKEA